MINITEKEIMKNWQGDISEPVVSICCITYNHEKYIEETIDSFLMQETNFPFEVVIGEDCSKDNTRKIVEEYKEKYPKIIKLIISENNVGMHKNFQRTIKASKGNSIALCEGDDYWTDKNKLQIQIDEMKSYPEIDISFHLASTIDKSGRRIEPILKENNKIYSINEIIAADFHLVQSNTIIIKKEKIDNLNFDLYLKSPVGDVWLRINAAIPNGALFINKTMSTYRIQSESSWSSCMQEDNKFMKFISQMMQSIDDFDQYWEFKYTKEFLIYKNMYIDVVMKKKLPQVIKKDFIIKNKDVMTINNLIKWNILYRYPNLVNFLKLLKNTIKGIFYVKTNNK